MRPWRIVTQESVLNGWSFCILAPNDATVAKSCRYYTTQQGAERAALNVLDAWRTNGIEVVTR